MRRLLLIALFAASCWALDLSPVGAPTGATCTVLDKGWYVTCYQPGWRMPQWVGEHLTPQQFRLPQVKRTGGFRIDPAVSRMDQAGAADYRGSGYDIGHQAPAGDFAFSPDAMRATFLFTNAVPQTPQLNRGPWRDLEVAVRALAAAEGDVWVFTGPAGGVKEIFHVTMTAPVSCWKTVLLIRSDGSHALYTYALPNSATPPYFEQGSESLSDLEGATKLHFFAAVLLSLPERQAVHQLPAHAPLPADAEQAKTIHRRK